MVYSGSITPPPTPPRVAFDPPLFLQRRTAVIDLLHKVHKLPRFNGKLRSLLDVGCGLECMLLGSLIALNDDLPLDQVTGIDLDDGVLDQTLVDSLGPNGQHVGDEGRWRKFGLTMLHGTFERLSLPVIQHHDIIVSAEVIEHLDPGPLSNFAPVLLGQLKPRVCIITTPNRDFNDLFSLPFTPEVSTTPNVIEEQPNIALGEEVDPENLPPAKVLPPRTTTAGEEAWRALSPGDVCSCGDKYWRGGVPYGMRHPDHRFEWTRQEFRDWAYKAAEDFGYDVTFAGVGGLGNGMCVYGSTGWAVGDALARGCGYNTGGGEAPGERDEGVLTKANEVWGDCTQIAIFTIREDEEEDAEDYIKVLDWSKQHPTDPNSTTTVSSMNPHYFPNPITQIIHHDFPYDTDEVFPPTFLTVMELLERELSNYLPNRIREQWSKSMFDIMQEKKNRKKHHQEEFLYESDSECDYGWNPDVDGDEVARQVRKKERRYEKRIRWEVEKAVLGGKSAELIKVVKVTGVSLKALWEGSIGGKKGLRRLCRFREEVFRDILMNGWKVQLGPGVIGEMAEGGWFCKPIIDTTGTYKETGTYNIGPVRRRQMSFSRTDSGSGAVSHPRTGLQLELVSTNSSPVKQRQPLNPSATGNEPQRPARPALFSHNLTSSDPPSTCSSASDKKVPEEDTPTMEPTKRMRSLSMPPSPISDLTAPALETIEDCSPPPSPSRIPLNRTHSDSKVPSSPVEPGHLPIQLESDTNMVAKVFSTSATRSVIDLIRRDLTEHDKETLKLWRMVKVEFNAQEPEPSLEEAVGAESVTDCGRDKFVQWQDEVYPEEGKEEDWAGVSTPTSPGEGESTSWDYWATDTSAGETSEETFTLEDTIPDNVSVTSDASLPYSIDVYGTGPDADPSPWNPNASLTKSTVKYHTELIYPLDNVDTILSIDKGKQREQESLQADLKGFLSAYKQLETNDKGFLNVDWKEYTKSKERVARWMEERRMEVQEYINSVGTMLAAGFKREEIPGRGALVEWEEWLEKVGKDESEEYEDTGWGHGDVDVGVVVFRPRGRGGIEEKFGGEKRDGGEVEDPTGLKYGAVNGGEFLQNPFAGWNGFADV